MHTFFSHACNACISPLGLVAPPKEFSDLDYVMGTAGQTFRAIVGTSPSEYRLRTAPVAVPTCFAMAWTRPSSFGEAKEPPGD